MAHFVLEYSDNLKQDSKSLQRLFASLHTAAESTGLFPLKGIRSRGYCCQDYRVADGNPDHGFAHLEVKLGAGRSMQDRQAAADLFFKVYCDHFADQLEERGLSRC